MSPREIQTSRRPLRRSVKKWATEFRRGRENIEADERSGCPKEATTDENVEIVHSLVTCDRKRYLQHIATKAGISFGAVQSILTDILGMFKVSARWVPRMLTEDQKRNRLDISRYLLSRYEDDPEEFMDRVVTQYETWVHHFDLESIKQSMQWKHPDSPLLRNLREFLQQGR